MTTSSYQVKGFPVALSNAKAKVYSEVQSPTLETFIPGFYRSDSRAASRQWLLRSGACQEAFKVKVLRVISLLLVLYELRDMTHLPPTSPTGGLFQREPKKSKHVLDRYEWAIKSANVEWAENADRKDHRLIISICVVLKPRQHTNDISYVEWLKRRPGAKIVRMLMSACCCFLACSFLSLLAILSRTKDFTNGRRVPCCFLLIEICH